MLKPNKYTNIRLSVIGLSSEIMKILSKDKALKYNQLQGRITHKYGEEAKANFMLALAFLYSLDLVNYRKVSDVIEAKGMQL